MEHISTFISIYSVGCAVAASIFQMTTEVRKNESRTGHFLAMLIVSVLWPVTLPIKAITSFAKWANAKPDQKVQISAAKIDENVRCWKCATVICTVDCYCRLCGADQSAILSAEDANALRQNSVNKAIEEEVSNFAERLTEKSREIADEISNSVTARVSERVSDRVANRLTTKFASSIDAIDNSIVMKVVENLPETLPDAVAKRITEKFTIKKSISSYKKLRPHTWDR